MSDNWPHSKSPEYEEQPDSSEELYERFQLTVDRGQEPLRIDKFLSQRIEGATRNKLQQAMHHDMVTVNGQPVKPNYKIKPGDQVLIYSDLHPEDTEVKPEAIPLDIRYEDDHLMIVHKPAGMVEIGRAHV